MKLDGQKLKNRWGKLKNRREKLKIIREKLDGEKKLKIRGEKLKMIWGKLKIKGVRCPNTIFFGSKNTAFLYYTRKLEHEKEKYDGKYTYVMVN